MSKEKLQNLRLGLFIVIGTLCLIIAFYMIGSKQTLFGSNVRISAQFYNVSGLSKGNNVRFAGIDVGTVEEVQIVSDSSVKVVMVINQESAQYIKKNSIASVGTDGLMGNKLVNINSSEGEFPAIEEGDVLLTRRPLETDEIIRTLNTTNENVKVITDDLRKITQRLSSNNSLWNLLMDTIIAENVKNAVVNIKFTSERTAVVTGDLSHIVKDIKAGKGSVGALLVDTNFSKQLNQAVVNVNVVSDKMAMLSGDLSFISDKLKKGEGSVGTLLMDTSFVHDLNQSMKNIKAGSDGFNQNMEALKHSIFFRKYFKKKKK